MESKLLTGLGILCFLAGIVLVSANIDTGENAVVVDSNTVTAARLTLTEIAPLNINITPGTNNTWTVNVTNTGTMKGNVTIETIKFLGLENGVLDIENKTMGDEEGKDLGCDQIEGDGELDNLVEVLLKNGDTIVLHLKDGELFTNSSNCTLTPGETRQLNLTVLWSPSKPPRISDLTAQTDSFEFALEIEIGQIGIARGFSDSKIVPVEIIAETWEEET